MVWIKFRLIFAKGYIFVNGLEKQAVRHETPNVDRDGNHDKTNHRRIVIEGSVVLDIEGVDQCLNPYQPMPWTRGGIATLFRKDIKNANGMPR
uniref:Uncharacterized protein n=1 Tax=Candidatus Kentrum sp. LFY TaxID=2126342 RepID=A0A450UAL7_9GAMM|nr:MAG: hypothetical protein BECKLFY1418B_GA0070995_101425 [Candidatus Kentron sp. LFY]